VAETLEELRDSSWFFASANAIAMSCWMFAQSSKISIDIGTNANAFSMFTVGCASTGALSEASVASLHRTPR
jgi:hypothetical protein